VALPVRDLLDLWLWFRLDLRRDRWVVHGGEQRKGRKSNVDAGVSGC
jgi:hypothetical protein